MNALAHGADSLYTPFANPVSQMTALRGAELIAASLDEGRAERNRAALAQGSLLCAYAIDSAAFGIHHVICQTLVRICGTPHAETNAAILPRALAFMAPRAPDHLASLAEALATDPDDIEARILQLGGDPPGLGDLGADRSKLDQALESMLMRPELAFTPEPPTRYDLEELIDRLVGLGHPTRRPYGPQFAAIRILPLPKPPEVGHPSALGNRRPLARVALCRARRATPALPRVHPPPQRQLAAVPAGAGPDDPVLPRLLPPTRTGRDHGRVKGGLIVAANHRSFLDPFVIGAALPWRRPMNYVAKVELFERRWQGWLLSRLGAFPIRRGESDEAGDGDGPPGGRARRHRLHLPRGDADPPRHAGGAEAGRRAARAADRRAGPADRRLRQRARAPRLADPAAPGAGAARPGDDLPARRAALAAAGGIGDGADLAQRPAAVGRDGRPAADAPRRGDRRRQLGHRGRRAARPRRARGAARRPHRRAGGGDGRGAREPALPGGGRAARLDAGAVPPRRSSWPGSTSSAWRSPPARCRRRSARSPTGSATAPRCCC